jgi:hypothetical protein
MIFHVLLGDAIQEAQPVRYEAEEPPLRETLSGASSA